ncbi:hypothetical protein EJ03DRAFT_153144 [Teratosphaeria nubilosa]|uniref:Uncharacterized protein n=1 Tax=Teratosphaeria nubilosa TaxID=161662 RepID=A0A6G1LKE2_9PEZI|nr:hypothetical protein EJ03DRAFT_153144 [Teratosphaeria nubilosa]
MLFLNGPIVSGSFSSSFLALRIYAFSGRIAGGRSLRSDISQSRLFVLANRAAFCHRLLVSSVIHFLLAGSHVRSPSGHHSMYVDFLISLPRLYCLLRYLARGDEHETYSVDGTGRVALRLQTCTLLAIPALLTPA